MAEDDAEWIADIYKSYGSCIQFPESDGASSLDGLDLTLDVDLANMLQNPRPGLTARKRRSLPGRRYLDSERLGRGVMTRCWETSSLRRVQPGDSVLPRVSKRRSSVERLKRDYRRCFDKDRGLPETGKSPKRNKPALRSVVVPPAPPSATRQRKVIRSLQTKSK